MSCGLGHRGISDLVLPWLWHRPAAAVQIWPLAWEPPYATGAALKRQKEKKKIDTHSKSMLDHPSVNSINLGTTFSKSPSLYSSRLVLAKRELVWVWQAKVFALWRLFYDQIQRWIDTDVPIGSNCLHSALLCTQLFFPGTGTNDLQWPRPTRSLQVDPQTQ